MSVPMPICNTMRFNAIAVSLLCPFAPLLILDAPPSREKAAVRSIERKDVAAAFAGLILAPADRNAFEMTEQQRADATMGNDRNVSFGRGQGDDVRDGICNPALRIDGPFPSVHAVLGACEE